MSKSEMIDVDLPSLQSITLGGYTLAGKWDDNTCSLVMRSNNETYGNE